MFSISNGTIKWVPYSREEVVCGRYSLDDWHKAVHDIDSDDQWADFLEKSDFVKCYILKLCKNDKSIAFVYTMQEDLKGTTFSIHGGGWENCLMYYQGFMLMIKHLLDRGLRVRTYCQLSNPRAIRFVRSVGFVPYRYTEDEVFLWISERRLTSSNIYKYFNS